MRILKSVEAKRTVKVVCREHGLSIATYYKWKSKHGGMEASGIERMKDLKAENRNPKVTSFGFMFGMHGPQGCHRKNFEAGSAKPARLAHDLWFREKHSQGLCSSPHQSELLRVVAISTRRQSCHRPLTALAEKANMRLQQAFCYAPKAGYLCSHKRVLRVHCLLKMY